MMMCDLRLLKHSYAHTSRKFAHVGSRYCCMHTLQERQSDICTHRIYICIESTAVYNCTQYV